MEGLADAWVGSWDRWVRAMSQDRMPSYNTFPLRVVSPGPLRQLVQLDISADQIGEVLLSCVISAWGIGYLSHKPALPAINANVTTLMFSKDTLNEEHKREWDIRFVTMGMKSLEAFLAPEGQAAVTLTNFDIDVTSELGIRGNDQRVFLCMRDAKTKLITK